jgi:hypothetical protein
MVIFKAFSGRFAYENFQKMSRNRAILKMSISRSTFCTSRPVCYPTFFLKTNLAFSAYLEPENDLNRIKLLPYRVGAVRSFWAACAHRILLFWSMFDLQAPALRPSVRAAREYRPTLPC